MSPPEFRVVLRSSTPTLPPCQLVFEHVHKVKVSLFGLIPTPKGYIAKVQSLEDIELLLKLGAVQTLSKINLTPLTPPDLLARKTVFVRQVESFVGEHTESQLKAEIQKLSRLRQNHRVFWRWSETSTFLDFTSLAAT